MVKVWQKKLLKLDSKLKLKIEKTLKLILNKKLDWLDIKPLKWSLNYFRCRIWQIRIIFYIKNWKIKIKNLWFRWDIYKK